MKHDLALSAPRVRNVIGICAGVGGLELGLQLALHHRGETVRGICYIEREAAAAASLVASMEAGWFHHAPVWSDAGTFNGRRFRGCVDIVTSGDPCQGNSVAGKRLGELDERWLLDRAIDIFDQSGADTFFRENVPGNADGQLAVAIPALERLGCRVAVGIFSSAETGNTMRRERLFILARRSMDGTTRWGERRVGGNISSEAHADGPCRSHGFDWHSVDSSANLDGAERPQWRSHGEPCDDDRQDGDAQWQEGAGRVGASSGELGWADRPHPQGQQPGQQPGQHHAAGRQVKSGPTGLSGGAILPPAVIPGPADNRGWIDVLDRWPEFQPALSKEEAQSLLCRGIDAMAHRVERLRATGNGVDPVAAAYAFLRLDALLNDRA